MKSKLKHVRKNEREARAREARMRKKKLAKALAESKSSAEAKALERRAESILKTKPERAKRMTRMELEYDAGILAIKIEELYPKLSAAKRKGVARTLVKRWSPDEAYDMLKQIRDKEAEYEKLKPSLIPSYVKSSLPPDPARDLKEWAERVKTGYSPGGIVPSASSYRPPTVRRAGTSTHGTGVSRAYAASHTLSVDEIMGVPPDSELKHEVDEEELAASERERMRSTSDPDVTFEDEDSTW